MGYSTWKPQMIQALDQVLHKSPLSSLPILDARTHKSRVSLFASLRFNTQKMSDSSIAISRSLIFIPLLRKQRKQGSVHRIRENFGNITISSIKIRMTSQKIGLLSLRLS